MGKRTKQERDAWLDEMEKRQSGMRMWSDAKGMYDAAIALRRDNESGHLLVRYQLLAQAFECACKGVLRATGATIRETRTYGHRIVEVYDEAVRRGLPMSISQRDYVQTNTLGEYYEDALLRYAAVGGYPGLSSQADWLERVVERVLQDSLPYCSTHVS